MGMPPCVLVEMANKTIKLIENTLSAGRGTVVSRKWYREGYFIEGLGVFYYFDTSGA